MNVIDAKVIDFKRWLEYRHRRFVDDGLQLTPSSTLSVDDGRVALKCTVKPSCVIIDFKVDDGVSWRPSSTKKSMCQLETVIHE